MKNWKRTISTTLALLMVFSCFSASLAAGIEDVIEVSKSPKISLSDITKIDENNEVTIVKEKGFRSDLFIENNRYTYKANEKVRAIVVFEDAPTAEVSNYSAAYRNSYLAFLMDQHNALLNWMSNASIEYQMHYEFTALLNAMSFTVNYGDLDKIADMEGVDAVYIANVYDAPIVEPEMESSNKMTGLNYMHSYGLGGSGTVIAILDSGITLNHEAFGVYDGMLTEAALDRNSVETLIDSGDISNGKYISAKIPFAYDYFNLDNDATDDNPTIDGHGTHVAGIAAGYVEEDDGAVTFWGSAPDAQILAMKIFSSDPNKPTTSSDVYFKALEDAYNLGADVINMSIGSSSGFTYDPSLESEVFGNIYKRLEDAGIICCVSAGNDYSMGVITSNFSGNNYFVTSDYADYGKVGTPSTYDGNLSVASYDNLEVISNTYFKLGDRSANTYPYNAPKVNLFLNATAGREFEYVMIPGYGEAKDYEGLDVEGKIAVISRGVTSFIKKIEMAYEKGAVAALIYNNESGMINMDLDGISCPEFPAASISQAAGLALNNYYTQSKAAGNTPTIVFPTTGAYIPSVTGGEPSFFSSWGVTPDLELKPQVSGVGGDILSAMYNSTDKYCYMSGTSMAAPNVTGGSATLLSYLREVYGSDYSDAEYAELVEDYMLSTADALFDGYLYSPRKQGAGLMNILYAALTPAYIDDPIQNLYDSEDGFFEFTFTVVNTSADELTYIVFPFVLADQPAVTPEGNVYNTMNALYLNDYCMIDAPSEVTVDAFSEAEVTISIQVDESMGLLELYPNGCYIDGYIYLEDINQQNPPIHATYMGFYGDWEDGDILEKYDFTDAALVDNLLATNYPSLPLSYLDVLEVNTDFNLAYLSKVNYETGKVTPYGYCGENIFARPYISYDPSRTAVPSPDSVDNALANSIFIAPINIRNARHLIMVVTDAETGEVYAIDDTEYLPKAAFDFEYGYWYGYVNYVYDGTDLDGNAVPSDTLVNIDFYANIDYGDDDLGAFIDEVGYEGLLANGEDYAVWSFDCTVDSTLPILNEFFYDEESEAFGFTASDNQFVSAVFLYDEVGNQIDDGCFAYANDGSDVDYTYTANEGDVFLIEVFDYASNYRTYHAKIENGKIVVTDTVTVTVSTNPNGVATVTGGGEYIIGETVTVTATPGNSHLFQGWFIGDERVSSDYTYSFVALEDTDLVALYTYDWSTAPKVDKDENTEAGENDGGSSEPELPFTDVSDSDVFYDAVKYVYINEIVSGTSNTTFSPNDSITRAQIVTILWRMDGRVDSSYDVNFSDVNDGDYFAEAVAWAAENGIVSGYEDGTFGPHNNVTLEQLIAILYRYASYKGYDLTAEADVSMYTDLELYAVKPMQWALSNGLIDENTDHLTAKASPSRAEYAMIVFNFCKAFQK